MDLARLLAQANTGKLDESTLSGMRESGMLNDEQSGALFALMQDSPLAQDYIGKAFRTPLAGPAIPEPPPPPEPPEAPGDQLLAPSGPRSAMPGIGEVDKAIGRPFGSVAQDQTQQPGDWKTLVEMAQQANAGSMMAGPGRQTPPMGPGAMPGRRGPLMPR